jgi:hypothetical protein
MDRFIPIGSGRVRGDDSCAICSTLAAAPVAVDMERDPDAVTDECGVGLRREPCRKLRRRHLGARLVDAGIGFDGGRVAEGHSDA